MVFLKEPLESFTHSGINGQLAFAFSDCFSHAVYRRFHVRSQLVGSVCRVLGRADLVLHKNDFIMEGHVALPDLLLKFGHELH